MRDTRNAHEDELQSLSFDERWDRCAPHNGLMLSEAYNVPASLCLFNALRQC